MRQLLLDEVRKSIRTVFPEVGDDILQRLTLESPRDPSHGDFSSNAAFLLKDLLRENPRQIAQRIADLLEAEDSIGDVSVAGPGFINFRVRITGVHSFIAELKKPEMRRRMLRDDAFAKESGKIQIEFVSANPTGPMNVVSARAAAFGDSCIRLLRAIGVDAHSEYYVNDTGNQATLFGKSLETRFQQAGGQGAELPEGSYRGRYVVDLARTLAGVAAAREAAGDSPAEIAAHLAKEAAGGATIARLAEQADAANGAPSDATVDAVCEALDFTRLGINSMVEAARSSLAAFGVEFDEWVRESSMHVRGESGESRVDEAERRLREADHVVERGGAAWFLSTKFGDDKDRVIRRSGGAPTYLLGDLAYHLDKSRRGFARVVDVWGPDHHGYIRRVLASMEALGLPKGWLEILIVQQVNLLRSGQPVKMSKREGELVMLDDLVDEVGRDVSRFFFLMRKASSHLDFDLELAKQESMENPVYYVQYAHARSRSIFRQPMARPLVAPEGTTVDLSGLTEEEEVAMMRVLLQYPETVQEAARALEPHRMVAYLREVAGAYHRFYTRGKREPSFRVLTEDESLSRARLFLVGVLADVLKEGLGFLGIEALEEM